MAPKKITANSSPREIISLLAELNGISLRKKESPNNNKNSGPAIGPTKRSGTTVVGGQSVEPRFKQSIPSITGMTMLNGTSSMIVEKTEALSDVKATGVAYEVKEQAFHVGSDLTPWLQSIGRSFVEYQILNLEFTYVPTVPTTTAGSFMMAFTGDYIDVNPADQPAFLQSEQALLGPVYSGTEGGRALQRFGFPNGDVVGFSVPKYTYCIGTTATPQTYRVVGNNTFTGYGTTDKNKYSCGKLIFATQGIKDATVALPVTVGQLFVRYKIRLLGSVKPTNNG